MIKGHTMTSDEECTHGIDVVVGKDGGDIPELEQNVLGRLSSDVLQKCREAASSAKDRNIFPNESVFAICVPLHAWKAGVCASDDFPEPCELEYITIGFTRYDGDIYITSVECVGGN